MQTNARLSSVENTTALVAENQRQQETETR